MIGQKKQIIIAGVCALLAAVSIFAYSATVKSEAQIQRAAAIKKYGGEVTDVCVAKENISTGQIIQSNQIQVMEYPVDLLAQGEVALSVEQVAGKVAAIDIKKNEVLLLERVGDGSSRISVPENLEAVSVATDDVLAVGGAIRAGSFVDVYVETTEGKIVSLGQNILVLETSSSQTNTTEKENLKALTWVTLAVTKESVSELITASAKGTIHLALPGNQVREKRNNE